MQRTSPQSLASAIWKSALLFLFFEQCYYKLKGKPWYDFVFFRIIRMLYHLLCIIEFEKNKLFDFDLTSSKLDYDESLNQCRL